MLCYSAGVQWVEMHKLAERVELEELKKCGILHGDVEEMMKVNKVYTLRVINFEGFKFSWFGNQTIS